MNKEQTTRGVSIPPELIDRAKAGDQEAFSELYRMTEPSLYRTIRSMVRDEDLTWDILQDSYIRAFRGIGKLVSCEAFLPWLRRIAVNETATHMARQAPLTFTDLADADGDLPEFADTRETNQPELVLDKQETSRLVREILETLPREQQLIVGMYYYEEMSIREIAAFLNIAPGTVKAQLFRGRKRIETGVRELEKKGVKLYGLAPLPFLLLLLRGIVPSAEAGAQVLGKVLGAAANSGAASAAAAGAGTPAGAGVPAAKASALSAGAAEAGAVTAKAVGAGFLHTLLGKLLVAAAALLLVGGGTLTYVLVSRNHSGDPGAARPPYGTEAGAVGAGSSQTVPGTAAEGSAVLYSGDDATLTCTGIRADGDCTVSFSVLDNTGDDVVLRFEDVAVNGCMVSCESEFSGSGSDETAVLTIPKADLEAYGIQTVTQISAVLVFSERYSRTALLRTEPLVVKTSAWAGEPAFRESGRPVYDNLGVRIYADRVLENEDGVPELWMTVVNRSDRAIEPEEAFGYTTVNRFLCTAAFRGFTRVTPGNCGLVRLHVDDSDMKKYHISHFNQIDMGFEILNADDSLECFDKSDPVNVWTDPNPVPETPYDPQTAATLLDYEGLEVTVVGWKRNERNDFLLEFYVDNHTGEYLWVELTSEAVNGTPLRVYDSVSVRDNDRSYKYLTLWSDDLEQAGIEAVTEITVWVEASHGFAGGKFVRSREHTVAIREGS